MSFEHWLALVGGLLLVLALTSAFVRRLPLSSALLYLLVGLALGPRGVGLLALDLYAPPSWFENVAEVALIVSLFLGGLRMRLSPLHRAWRPAWRLAGPVMLLGIVGLASYAALGLGFGFAGALLLGAVLAPTDPVLASAVSVSHAADHDRVRYALSGEAGFNDGAAFPFVVLAVEWAAHGGSGAWLVRWSLLTLIWATVAGLGVGYVLGHGIGRLVIRLRHRLRESEAPNDLLALALIALAYSAAHAVGGWGFLAAFAAGVGLRNAEVAIVHASPHPDWEAPKRRGHGERWHPPAEHLVLHRVDATSLDQKAIAAGVVLAETLSFGETVERLLEMILMVLVGVAFVTHWDWRGVPLALFSFLLLRPAVVHLCLPRTETSLKQRWLIGLFGIRGIGTLYYLAYVAKVGFAHPSELHAVGDLAVTVVTCSVILHGISATPLLRWYENAREHQAGERHAPPTRDRRESGISMDSVRSKRSSEAS